MPRCSKVVPERSAVRSSSTSSIWPVFGSNTTRQWLSVGAERRYLHQPIGTAVSPLTLLACPSVGWRLSTRSFAARTASAPVRS